MSYPVVISTVFPRSPVLSCLALAVAALGGCSMDRPLRTPDVSAAIRAELPPEAPAVAQAKPAAVPARVMDALAEPAPPAQPLPPEPRIDLLVNNAQAREVFLAIVADTRYSMLMHPDVKGTLSVTLRGVTVTEALESIRDVYGYDFKMEGRRITIYAPTLQTRVFTVNYPNSQRTGNSETRVSSGGGQTSTAGTTGAAGATGSSNQQPESSRGTTSSKTDFWAELAGKVPAGTTWPSYWTQCAKDFAAANGAAPVKEAAAPAAKNRRRKPKKASNAKPEQADSQAESQAEATPE